MPRHVHTEPDCPFCRRVEREFAGMARPTGPMVDPLTGESVVYVPVAEVPDVLPSVRLIPRDRTIVMVHAAPHSHASHHVGPCGPACRAGLSLHGHRHVREH